MFEVSFFLKNKKIVENKKIFNSLFIKNNLILNSKIKNRFHKKMQINFIKSNILNTLKFNIFKPKNQFFFNYCINKKFLYSTGLVLRALELPSRSTRRNKIGFNVFLHFY